MQARLFEVLPRPGHEDQYFRSAAALRPLLAGHDGLLFLDRYRSESRPGIILSHSHWRDEASLARWRADGQHHAAQCAGRREHFQDYRIRISHVLRAIARTGEDTHYAEDGAYADPERTPRAISLSSRPTAPASPPPPQTAKPSAASQIAPPC